MAQVLVIGGGLAGGLLALALAERGAAVQVVAAPGTWATDLSYGGVPWWAGPPGPMGELMATAPSCWRELEQRHGPLGWRPCELVLHGPRRLEERHPYARIDGAVFGRALPAALGRAGVGRITGQVLHLRPQAGGWVLELQGGGSLRAEQVVLAAGAGCLALWPGLQGRLMASCAGVLHSKGRPEAELPWGEAIVMPREGKRQELEGRATSLRAEEWIVDAGLAPRGAGLLLGQTTLVRPGGTLGTPPDSTPLEAALRQELTALWPEFEGLPAHFDQVPVAFTPTGIPLAGPVAGVEGLWAFSGFSGPYALVPPLAPLLAAAITKAPGALGALEHTLLQG